MFGSGGFGASLYFEKSTWKQDGLFKSTIASQDAGCGLDISTTACIAKQLQLHSTPQRPFPVANLLTLTNERVLRYMEN